MSSKYCIKCGYPLVKNGKRKLKYRAEIQQYKCKRCGKYHSDNDFPNMKFTRKIIEAASMLRHKGMALKDVRDCISRIFNIVIKSISVIWYWTQRFPNAVSDISFKALGSLLHADETQVRTNKKGRKFYMWALKSPKTKAIVTHVSETRTEKDAEELLKKAKRMFPVGYLPDAIRTDSFPGYYPAIMHVFGYHVKQDRFRSFESHSNNEIENLFRCKRKFPRFGAISAAKKFVDYWEKDHNKEKLGNDVNIFSPLFDTLLKSIMRFMK